MNNAKHDHSKRCSVDYKNRVCKAMNFISKNIERELSLEEIANAASFSKYHFHRIFKDVVGETVAGFTRRLRLELAANRLISRPLDDITSIALDCGFSSSQNFAKAFRQHFAMTPSEYRLSKNGNFNRKNEKALSLQTIYDSDTVFMNSFQNERRNKMNAEVREMSAFKVAYVRKVGPYDKKTCESAFVELMKWAVPRNFVGPEKVLAIYWDNPDVTPAEQCRFDACIKIPDGTVLEGKIHIQTISGGPYAICHFETSPDRIRHAWEDALKWVCDSGLKPNDTPCYELYHNNAAEHPEGKWIYDLCIPLNRHH